MEQTIVVNHSFPGILSENGGWITKDYDSLIFHQLNRVISEDALLDLEEDMNEDINEFEYPFQEPIVVYYDKEQGKFIIQSGHHRYLVCKKQNRELKVVISDYHRSPSRGFENEHVSWTNEELIESYAEEGIESYSLLVRLKDKYPQYSFIALSVFINGVATNKSVIRHRKFKLKCKDYIESYSIADNRIQKFEEYKKATQREDNSKEVIKVLVRAMEKNDFNWEFFIQRARANANEAKIRPEFSSISTNARAISLIEFLYNYKSKRNFYFYK